MKKLLVRSAQGERELLLAGTTTVGRDPSCEISADDGLLSRRHAEFVVSGDRVVLRDLKSRNGIRVNGIGVKEATLHPNDEIQIAGFTIRYLTDDPPAARPANRDADDNTIDWQPDLEPIDDRTILHPPPTAVAPLPPPPKSSRGVPPPPGPGRLNRPAVVNPPPQASPTKAKAVKARKRQASWGGLLLTRMMAVAVVSFLLGALPLLRWQSRLLDSVGASRAEALTNWLAADAAATFATGQEIGSASDRISREPGVVSALVLSPTGRVLAPASRSTEVFESIPGLNAAPSQIFGLRRAPTGGGLVQVVTPIATREGERRAVAWLAFRPSVPPEAGSAIIVVGPALLLTLAVALFVAGRIRRTTIGAIAGLNEEIELAISGQLDIVKDPLGAKPAQDLADTVNYLVARVRATAAVGGRPATDNCRPGDRETEDQQAGRMAPRPARPAAGPEPPAQREARIVVDARYRITEANDDCAALLGLKPASIVGQHLVDALQPKSVVDAVLKCLGGVSERGEQQATISPEGQTPALLVIVARHGKDQPVNISIRPSDSRRF